MKKKWIKFFLFLEKLVMLALSALCTFTLIRSSVIKEQEKKEFESIYRRSTVSFIVPGPSYVQVEEIRKNADNGIDAFVPFFETSNPVDIGGKSGKGQTIVLPEADKVESTLYCSKRIVAGKRVDQAGKAIVDQLFAQKNNCKVGDEISLSLSGLTGTFVIGAIVETNTLYDNGTVAVVITDEQAKTLRSSGAKYSAAYVSSKDYDKCKDYLYKEYKPYGRLKDESEFGGNLEAYEKHVGNFNDADWTKEITNLRDNYNKLSVKYSKIEDGRIRNMIIVLVTVFVCVVAFDAFVLRKSELRKYFQTILIKKSGTIDSIKKFYGRGFLFGTVVFCISAFVEYYYVVKASNARLICESVKIPIVMILLHVLITFLMILVSKLYVNGRYSNGLRQS